jgi:adenine deaminase
MNNLKRLLAVARGDVPADLLLINARIINVFTGEVEEGNVAVAGDRIAGVGDYAEAAAVVDLQGRYLAPGLIDGHVHVESSYLHVDQYARAVVPRGTLAVCTDLHEIANVAGLPGIHYILECARQAPLDLFLMAPPCVPATHMETSGATLTPDDIHRTLHWEGVAGLGEMMNFPAVIRGDDDALAKIAAASARPKEGHAPRVRGRGLNAYCCALIGSDHETTERDEGLEKLRRGMYLMIREGSTEKNLADLLPLVTDRTYHRCMFVVDDRNAKDLLHDGDLDAVVRKAIRLGLDPVRALTLATLTPATFHRLEGFGAVAPGYVANLLVIGDLRALDIQRVYHRGRLVARDGRALFDLPIPAPPSSLDAMNVKPFAAANLALRSAAPAFPVIEIVPGQIITGREDVPPARADGAVVADPARDLLKLVCIERHHGTGNIGVGLVKGFGLARGAIGSSFAHDSHNLVVVGVDDGDIVACAEEIIRNRGGLAVAADGRVTGSLPLPIGGLLSPEPLEWVAARLEELEAQVRALGCAVPSPFSVLSFIALPVIPELKITDMGLVDVMAGRFVDLEDLETPAAASQA